MTWTANLTQWILGALLILSSVGVLLSRKPIYASLSFLLSLLVLATIYLELSAQFIAAMQILVYAGAILVIFVFVVVLFQDAHQDIEQHEPKSQPLLLALAIASFLVTLLFLVPHFMDPMPLKSTLPKDFGLVQGLGQALYLDFFFPFEAVVLLFLVAIVGALYIAKKGR